MQQMRNQMGDMNAMLGGQGGFSLLDRDVGLIPGGDSGNMQSYSSSYTSVSDGKGPARVTEHSRMLRKAPGQVAEMKERRRDTHEGIESMASQRQIGNKAVKVSRALNHRTQATKQDGQLYGMSESEAGHFNQQWSNASRGLPPAQAGNWGGAGGGRQSLGGRGGGGNALDAAHFDWGGSNSSHRGNGSSRAIADHSNTRQRSFPKNQPPQIGTPGRGINTNRSDRGQRSRQRALPGR